MLTKEMNVLKGQRLVVDLTTGEAKIDGGKGGVSALLLPSSIQDEKKKQEQPQKQPATARKQPCT